jgi:hypothetical protein
VWWVQSGYKTPTQRSAVFPPAFRVRSAHPGQVRSQYAEQTRTADQKPDREGQGAVWHRPAHAVGCRRFRFRRAFGGSKTFVFGYRPRGGGRSVNPRLLKLGAFPSISLDDARAAARIHAGNIAKGEDPAQQRAQERRRNRATLTKLLAAAHAHGDRGATARHQRAPFFVPHGIVDVRLHDLRRTVRTTMSRLGIPEDVSEMSIGDQRADLIARYNKDQAWLARVEAFEAVSAHISGLLTAAADDCGNVVPIHGGLCMQ